MSTKIGDRIYLLRKQSKMTQEELGTILGVGRSAVLKYEKDDGIDIPTSKIIKMAEVFGVSPSSIMGFGEYEREDLEIEVKLHEMIQARYGKDTIRVLNDFLSLNDEGKKHVLNLIDDIASMPKYQKESSR